MLIFLNIYSSGTTRGLIYHAKEASLWDKAQMISSAFSGAERLSAQNAEQIISLLGDLNVSHVVVTDGEGELVYDSAPNAVEQIRFSQIEEALEGRDVFYCRYDSGVLESHAAIPMMLYGLPLGCVYVSEVDMAQGAIIASLEMTILRISLAVEAILIVFSAVFAYTSSRKMQRILDTMQKVGEGAYGEKLRFHGTDEYALIAGGFNKLTERLQQSEQAQKQFVSDASHELKTPLASIKLLSDSILQNEMDAETMREFVTDIGNEADRLTRLTQDLLAISKAEMVTREHEVVDLAQVISKVFKMLVSLADVRGIRLTCNMEKTSTVLTVEDDMYQIVYNLVENAIKYNHDEGLVHVDLRQGEEDVILTVEDTGIGIPEEALEHIFERFYRVDKARSRAQGGSGLGLSIVQELVGRNYGHIEVARREEGGTRFTVSFPRFDVDEA
ncbi:MAG: HAMP domain-containing histidine kinase [Oscillospiraceae bacterium]|nr:HAMP domain-containing histidine kinase [Oscillospiraceae bacterium]